LYVEGRRRREKLVNTFPLAPPPEDEPIILRSTGISSSTTVIIISDGVSAKFMGDFL